MFAGAVSSIDGVTPDAMDDQTTFRANEYLLELSPFHTVSERSQILRRHSACLPNPLKRSL
jgi:hypothetical protein